MKYHELRGLKQKLIVSQLWRLKSEIKSSGLNSSEGCKKESVLCLASNFWWFAGSLASLVFNVSHSSLPSSHGVFPVCLCVQIFTFYKDTRHNGLGPNLI